MELFTKTKPVGASLCARPLTNNDNVGAGFHPRPLVHDDNGIRTTMTISLTQGHRRTQCLK